MDLQMYIMKPKTMTGKDNMMLIPTNNQHLQNKLFLTCKNFYKKTNFKK